MFDVELIDHKENWDALVAKVRGLTNVEGNVTEVGLFGDTKLVQIAKENEFGDAPKSNRNYPIPERSFLRFVFDKDLDKNSKLLMQGIDDIITGKRTSFKVLDDVGDEVATSIKKFILSDHYKFSKPNHPITIKIKGHDNPLIQIGKIFSLITHKVGKGEPRERKETITINF